MILSCHDFVYLNKHLYQPSEIPCKSINPPLNKKDVIHMQHNNLLQLLQMILLKRSCLHMQLEELLCIPCEPLHIIVSCGNSCLSCLELTQDYIMSVNSSGITSYFGRYLYK